MRRVVVATGNRGKLDEIRSALDFAGWEFVTAADLGASALEVEETGDTFEANARLKARAYREAFGVAALADDSGLEVDALDGVPGVYSSRYAGSDATDAANNAKLLAALADIPEEGRTARFRSVIVLIDEEGAETVAEGACEGTIGFAPRGTGGFGYDPLFHPRATPGRTMAELDRAGKNAISHRGQALRALKGMLGD
ncbi:MAG: RdgB/HAM1 family non-canonical purine NTP pyrophosphatase [Coriobacteriia bacterium]|nr:RdgB/HAM1 family non-canonical purine NTP pyrophosphatase [Coriobacteriia bacterium]MBN2840365.1 RdgB/HAM1 family non-canonical purine NTP pyrophosphatase [Coriobacteriia bacterium]